MNKAYFGSIRVRKAWEVGRMMCSLPTFSPSSRRYGCALFCLLHISLTLRKLFSPSLRPRPCRPCSGNNVLVLDLNTQDVTEILKVGQDSMSAICPEDKENEDD
ncbi:uncharacterized [Tachysurus ichikawai]